MEIKDKEINSLKAELKSAQVQGLCSVFFLSFLGLEGDAPFRPDTVVINLCPHAWLLFNNLAALQRQ